MHFLSPGACLHLPVEQEWQAPAACLDASIPGKPPTPLHPPLVHGRTVLPTVKPPPLPAWPCSLFTNWFSRKLLPWRALPQTPKHTTGPLRERRSLTVASGISNFFVDSLKHTRLVAILAGSRKARSAKYRRVNPRQKSLVFSNSGDALISHHARPYSRAALVYGWLPGTNDCSEGSGMTRCRAMAVSLRLGGPDNIRAEHLPKPILCPETYLADALHLIITALVENKTKASATWHNAYVV